MNAVRLELGCGRQKEPGYLGMDLRPWPGVDVVCNLEKALPLADNVVSELYSNHVLEHVGSTVDLMQEVYRVCQNGARVRIRVPYFTGSGAFADPTHRSFFSEVTWEYFDRQTVMGDYYRWPMDFAIEGINFEYPGRLMRWLRPWPRLQAYLRNRLWNVVSSISVTLRVRKPPTTRAAS